MPLELAPLTVADVDAYMAIRTATFGDTVFRIFFPQPAAPSTLEKVRQDICSQIQHNKHAHFLKVTDSDTGVMVAGAKWKVFPCELTDAELEKELELPKPLPGADPEMSDAFMQMLADARREVMGKRAYWMLDALTTHPEHHRRGAGGLLTRWGLERADEAGLETYLEASEMGQPLYERFGFEAVKDMPFDMGKFGGEGELNHKAMLRPKRAS